jgi:hypothetical protein
MEKTIMGQVLHTNARTTEAIRREIRNSEESIAKAASKFNVNPKTIIKWRKREDPKVLPMGPKKILFQKKEKTHFKNASCCE